MKPRHAPAIANILATKKGMNVENVSGSKLSKRAKVMQPNAAIAKEVPVLKRSRRMVFLKTIAFASVARKTVLGCPQRF